MKQDEIAAAKYMLGRMFDSERGEVLGRFDSIPKNVKNQVLYALSAKAKKKKLDEKKLATWAEHNLSFLDQHLIPIEFYLFKEAAMRATGPA